MVKSREPSRQGGCRIVCGKAEVMMTVLQAQEEVWQLSQKGGTHGKTGRRA